LPEELRAAKRLAWDKYRPQTVWESCRLIMGMKKARLSNRAFFWLFNFATKIRFSVTVRMFYRFINGSL